MDFREIKEFLIDIFKYIVTAVIVFLLVIYVITFQQVMGPSMENTLVENDIIVVNKLVYRFKSITRNEVVVLKYKEKSYIKRVIGLPGEHIAYKNNILYINNEKYTEEFITELTDDFDIKTLGYEVIPDDMFLVLGDNRINSEDGREFGLISKNDIIGKASIRIWPLFSIKFVK